MRMLGWGCLLLVVASGCSKKGEWLVGSWLLLDPEGKPGVCHEFRRDGVLTVYTSSECSGDKDQISSGRWEMKEENRLAVLRYNERAGQLVLVTERDAQHFVCRGGIAGTMFKVGAKGSSEVLAELDRQGAIKVKPLDPSLGCRQLALPLKDIRALPSATAEDVRMLRHKDQALRFQINRNSSDPRIDKTVYALNDESLEWVALHLTEAAFNPPGPRAVLEASAGRPAHEVAVGAGAKRQHIVMWKAYCALSTDTPKREIDVTLFATAGEKRGTIYVSDNVVSGLWDELQQTAQSAGTEIEEDERTTTAGEADKVTTKPAPKAKTEPQSEAKKPAGKKGETSDDDDI